MASKWKITGEYSTYKTQKMTLHHYVVLNVRGANNCSLGNPRSNTFPKLYVNEAIVLGDLGL